MTTVSPSQWVADPTIDILWRTWGDETIIYNTHSGDTHLLNKISAEALRILQRSPADAESLTKEVASRYGLGTSQELFQNMEKLLSLFSGLGLIIPANEA